MRRERGFTVVEVVIVVVVAVLIGGWVYSWQRAQQGASQEAAATPTPAASSSVSAVASNSASPAPTTDPYVGWKTYTQANGFYSFKYPANWVVSSRSIGGLDNVTVSKSYTTEVQFYRYIDGVGCGEQNPPTKQALVGSTTMTLTADCGGPYAVTTWVESQPHTKEAGSAVRITAAFGKGEDTNVALILGSVTGLIPMSGQ